MRPNILQLDQCVGIVEFNALQGKQELSNKMCTDKMMEQGLDLPEATELFIAARLIYDLNLIYQEK